MRPYPEQSTKTKLSDSTPRDGRSYTIGLIIHDVSSTFFSEVTRAIEDACFQQGLSLILCNSNNNLEKETRYLEILTRKKVDGIIFVASGSTLAEVVNLKEHNIPMVLVDREVEGMEIDKILVDNYMGGYMATDHLIELGHTRIASIAGPSRVNPSAGRIAGYHKAVDEAGLEIDPQLLYRGDNYFSSAQEALRSFINMNEPPTAIFANNDNMAIAALSLALQMGISIPQELSIIGFDDILLSSVVAPPLTTVAQPKREIGFEAVDLLIKRIQDPGRPAETRLLDTRLIIRRSTAPPNKSAIRRKKEQGELNYIIPGEF